MQQSFYLQVCLPLACEGPYEMNLFDTLVECCEFRWIDYGLCMTAGEGGQDDVGGGGLYDLEGVDFYPD